MAKTTGLGDNFYISGYNLSGDINSLGTISTPRSTLDVTGIDKSAYERLLGERDGQLAFTSFFNPAAGQAHPVLSALPTADVVASYFRGTVLGNPAFSLVGKQIDYAPTRGNDGALTVDVSAQANAYGADWGQMLTAGLRTDTAATNGTGVDISTAQLGGATSAALGAFGYLHVTAFAGTSVTVKIQDSADNSTFADVTGLAFTAVTAAPASERIATASNATIRRYVRAVTTGTFTSVTFAVNLAAYNPVSGGVAL